MWPITFLEEDKDTWAQGIDAIRTRLNAPNNPLLFPAHYLKSTFLQIGGRVFVLDDGSGVGCLFPKWSKGASKEYVLRFYDCSSLSKRNDPSWRESLIQSIQKSLPEALIDFYSPLDKQTYISKEIRTVRLMGEDIQISTPSLADTFTIRELQRTLWNSAEDELYPADIHSIEFHMATSLVAKREEKIIGFLFGFYRFGGVDLPEPMKQRTRGEFRVESQLLGTLNEYRNHGIAFHLKKTQAELALLNGVNIVNWTVDPLQFGNAVLNLGKLKATAFTFYRQYYDFNNMLNRVSASRLGITWFTNTERVKKALAEPSSRTLQLSELGDETIQRVNVGIDQLRFDARSLKIAIELPEGWTRLQAEDIDLALKWRNATDRLFEHYLGSSEGKYIITGVGTDAEKRFLIGERVDRALIDRLSL